MLWHLILLKASFFYIKQPNSDLYIASEHKKDVSLMFAAKDEADKLTAFEYTKIFPFKRITIQEVKDSTLTYNQSQKILVFLPYDGKPNQRFEFYPIDLYKNFFLLGSEGECVEYDLGKKQFLRKKCDKNNQNQLFEFVYPDQANKRSERSRIFKQ